MRILWLLCILSYAVADDLDECASNDGECVSQSHEQGTLASPARPILFTVISPANQQEFFNSSVPINIVVANDEDTPTSSGNTPKKVCWKLVVDADCNGFHKNEATATEARTLLAAKQDRYHSCVKVPTTGTLQLSASCWIFQFDFIDHAGENVIAQELHSIRVVAVDDAARKRYPNAMSWSGGERGAIHNAVVNKGMGMVLEFGLGQSTMHLSRELMGNNDDIHSLEGETTMIHSFDSLEGLPDKWRDGFDKGHFSFQGKNPVSNLQNVHVHKGWINETLPPFLDANPIVPVGLLVIDVCLESSTLFVLDQLACRLYEGSIVLFGSFFNFANWTKTRGERSAWRMASKRWGIQAKPIGYSSTFVMFQMTRHPRKCPGSDKSLEQEGTFDSDTRDWVARKMSQAAEFLDGVDRNETYRDKAVQLLEEIIAVDPNNAKALGYLAFILKDVSRISNVFDYAKRALVIQHRMPYPGTDPVSMLTSLDKEPSRQAKFERTVPKHRLRHDLEQLQYLLDRDRLPRKLAESAIAAYKEVLSQFPTASETDILTLSWSQWEILGPFFNRALHLPIVSRTKNSAVNSSLNFTELQATYNTSDPHVVVVDDFLSQEALDKLLMYYREATIFYDFNHESYLGSYMTDGLGNPVLAQVVEEVAAKMRPILCDRPLQQAWVFKYDDTDTQKGIDIHADSAAVNFNLWLGENQSLDPNGGGLVIYTEKAPDEWSFDMYNTKDSPKMIQMLQNSGFKNITVPYKQNRMIMFDSKLFHVSDIAGWKPGYEKRRINLTLLFGKENSKCKK